MRSLPLLLAALLLAGCFGAPGAAVRVVPYVALNDAQPGRVTEFAFYVESTSTFRQDVDLAGKGPEGWAVEPEALKVSIPGGKATSILLRVTPDANATDGVHEVTLDVGGIAATVLVNVRQLGNATLAAGMGARVYYVLWLDNATLFATNLKAAADQDGIPEAPSNETPSWTPLKVYVGGERGKAPPEPYNSTDCDADEPPPCYHPVIPGFDARLRGMVEGETLAVRVPKEQAYTVPGNETHPLYGQNLNFLVRVERVVQYAVRACALPVCPPTG